MTARALCVGINEFAHLPTSSWLNGCVNDANDMSALLLTQPGFTRRNVTVLADAAATKANVMTALTDMVGKAKAGALDHVVFSFSSHGTQVPDTNGDEKVDHVDEAFACHDIAQKGDDWDRDTVIVDDELNVLLQDIPKGVLVEVVLDTCHSGTGLRDIDLLSGRRPRFLPPPTRKGILRLAPKSDPKGLQELVRSTPAATRAVLYAACRADQTSADAYFDGRYNGAFTYYFLEAVKGGGYPSRSALMTAVSQALRTGDFEQRAQLEASQRAKRSAFGALPDGS
ncbi:caspase family protein [Lapillicoccus sp.]|uniref:caspase family protein n=1 Tax=Lapillicoccus sp. TaxID=1909287 RepID=UPI003264789E